MRVVEEMRGWVDDLKGEKGKVRFEMLGGRGRERKDNDGEVVEDVEE